MISLTGSSAAPPRRIHHTDGTVRGIRHEVYIADYEHLGVYACRILVPGVSDVYPVEDLHMANNAMGIHLRETILALPESVTVRKIISLCWHSWMKKAMTISPRCCSHDEMVLM